MPTPVIRGSSITPFELDCVRRLTRGEEINDVAWAHATDKQNVFHALARAKKRTGAENRIALALWYVATCDAEERLALLRAAAVRGMEAHVQLPEGVADRIVGGVPGAPSKVAAPKIADERHLPLDEARALWASVRDAALPVLTPRVPYIHEGVRFTISSVVGVKSAICHGAHVMEWVTRDPAC